MKAKGPLYCVGALRNARRDKREQQGTDVREDMTEVGDKRERMGGEAAVQLERGGATDNRERAKQSTTVLGAMRVRAGSGHVSSVALPRVRGWDGVSGASQPTPFQKI